MQTKQFKARRSDGRQYMDSRHRDNQKQITKVDNRKT